MWVEEPHSILSENIYKIYSLRQKKLNEPIAKVMGYAPGALDVVYRVALIAHIRPYIRLTQ